MAILEGFPRTVEQAIALDRLLIRRDLSLQVVIELVVNENTLLARIEDKAQRGLA